MDRKLIHLSDDQLNTLFPSEKVQLGETTVIIRPLGLEDLILISDDIVGLMKKLSDKGITADNYESRMSDVAMVVISEYPNLVSVVTNIDPDTIRKLPLATNLDIVVKALKVNMYDQEAFLKNLVTLVDLLENATAQLDKTLPGKLASAG